MKPAIVMGVITVLFMTILSACGKMTESNRPQEEQDMTSNVI